MRGRELERCAKDLGPPMHVAIVVRSFGGAERGHGPVTRADPSKHAAEQHGLVDKLDACGPGDVRGPPRREIRIRARKVEPQLESHGEETNRVCTCPGKRCSRVGGDRDHRAASWTFPYASRNGRLASSDMAKLVDGFKDGKPELGRRTFLVPENHSEVLALLYHEQTGIVGGLPVGPVTTDPFGAHGIRMYPDQDPVVLEETRRYFEKLAERFSNDLPKA